MPYSIYCASQFEKNHIIVSPISFVFKISFSELSSIFSPSIKMDNKAFKSSESSDYLEGKYRPQPKDSAVRDINKG